MTLNELLFETYGWADRHAASILGLSLLLPALGTGLSWIGKGGKTDQDGRLIASAFIGVSLLAVTLEVFFLFLARTLHNASPLDANVALLLAPIISLVGCVAGIRMVFPLSELGSVRTAADLGAFLLCCAAIAWFFSKFRGWSLIFFGSFTQLVVVLAIAVFFMRRLYRRAFGLQGRRGQRETPVSG